MTPMTDLSAPSRVERRRLREAVPTCGLLIAAAGFERRAKATLDLLDGLPIRRAILIQYAPGYKENDAAFSTMNQTLRGRTEQEGLSTVLLDPKRPEEFALALSAAIARWRPDLQGEVWVDISAMVMQGICISLSVIRELAGERPVRILYTEAETYWPTEAEVTTTSESSPKALSDEMATNLIPKRFSGLTGEGSTCLLLFAGYEPHRSLGAIELLNPSKLVTIYGVPGRKELGWRLDWSKKLHQNEGALRPTSTEVVSTLDPLESLRLLTEYYKYLFADHNIAVSPVCSKMQCVAAFLLWERFRDVQLVFPLPISYLPTRFSSGIGSTYQFMLPTQSTIASELQLLR